MLGDVLGPLGELGRVQLMLLQSESSRVAAIKVALGDGQSQLAFQLRRNRSNPVDPVVDQLLADLNLFQLLGTKL